MEGIFAESEIKDDAGRRHRSNRQVTKGGKADLWQKSTGQSAKFLKFVPLHNMSAHGMKVTEFFE